MIVTIGGHCFDGAGKCPASQGVWKVPGAVPGDTVRIRPLFPERGRGMAELLEVIEPSPARRPCACPHANVCMGCALQQRTDASQREFKRAIVRDCLERFLPEPGQVQPVVPSSRAWGYRTKAILRVARRSGLLCMMGQGRQLVPLTQGCMALLPALSSILERVQSLLKIIPDSLPDMLMLRAGRRTHMIQIAFAFREPPSVKVFSWCREFLPLANQVVLTWHRDAEAFWGAATEVVIGDPEIQEILSGMRFFMGHRDFFQSNLEQAEWMHRWVGERIGVPGIRRVLDLCCGVGPFALDLARRGCETVVGIDENRGAILRARRNAWENALQDRTVFLAHGLKGAGRFLLAKVGRFDGVVVDPPRGGLAREGCDSLLALKPEWIAYVSCHPFTLAQDLSRLWREGYAIREIQPVDVYPQTRHVEILVLLQKAR